VFEDSEHYFIFKVCMKRFLIAPLLISLSFLNSSFISKKSNEDDTYSPLEETEPPHY
jgi:uncharacterized coiled-coil protein SlyX